MADHKHRWRIVKCGLEPVGIACGCGETRPVAEREKVGIVLPVQSTPPFTTGTSVTTTFFGYPTNTTWSPASSGTVTNGYLTLTTS